VLILSGVKLLDVPAANWVIAAGLVTGAIALAWYGVRSWLTPRPQPEQA
jgi:hypothetical protein